MVRLWIAYNIQFTKATEEFLINCILFVISVYLAAGMAAFFLLITELRKRFVLFFFHLTP